MQIVSAKASIFFIIVGLPCYLTLTLTSNSQCIDSLQPRGCFCDQPSKNQNQTEINLYTIRCLQIPSMLTSSPEEINMWQTGLSQDLPPFQLSNGPVESVKVLNLADNKLRRIPARAFADFPNLRVLRLSDNWLSEIDRDAFEGLDHLEELYLDSNDFFNIPIEAISKLSSLRKLDVSGCLLAGFTMMEVRELSRLGLRAFFFARNPVKCSCDLFYLHNWLTSAASPSITHSAGPVCEENNVDVDTNALGIYLRRCSAHIRPIIQNITAISCDSVYVKWEYHPFTETYSRPSYIIRLHSMDNEEEREIFTRETDSIIPRLSPSRVFRISIQSVVDSVPSKTSNFSTIVISQYTKDNIVFECYDYIIPDTFDWYTAYRITAIVLIIVICFLVCAFCFIVCSLCCTRARGLSPSSLEPRPAYGYETRPVMMVRPGQAGIPTPGNNAAALLSYAHLDTETHPRSTADGLRMRIMETPGVRCIELENIAYNKVLYSGKFGTMFEGEAFMVKNNEYQSKVTIIEFSQRRLFERNGSRLITLAALSHPNIFNILAVVQTGGPLCLVFDYTDQYRDLKHFLRDTKSSKLANSNKIAQTLGVPALNLIASQVASGMTYLARNNFVHGDVAARSVLIGNNSMQVKIAYLGSGVDAHPGDYLRTGNRNLPIRWMSPETIQYGTSTTHSDVWSFGVFLWELYSCGELPYEGLAETDVAAITTSKGCQLHMPKDCQKPIWTLARECWVKEPVNRITFPALENRMLSDVWNISISVLDESMEALEPSDLGITLLNRLDLSEVSFSTIRDATIRDASSEPRSRCPSQTESQLSADLNYVVDIDKLPPPPVHL